MGLNAGLNNSKSFLWTIDMYMTWKNLMANFQEKSLFVSLIKNLQKKIFLFSVRTGSIFLIVLVGPNIFFSLMQGKEIVWLTLFIKSSLLFLGWTGLCCRCDWQTLKETSFFLNLLDKISEI